MRFFFKSAAPLALVLGFSQALQAADLDEAFGKALAASGLPASGFSVSVSQAGRTLFALNDAKPVPVASTAKVVTTLAALEILTPAYTWKTRFYTSDEITPKSATVQKLFIKGGLDPHYVYEDLVKDALRLKSMGISRVTGDIVVDRARFDPYAGAAQNASRSYEIDADAALFNFSSVVLRITPEPAKGSALIAPEVALDGLKIPKYLPLKKGFCPAWRQSLKADFSQPMHPVFKGFFPAECKERLLTYPVNGENVLLASGIRAVFKHFGIRFSGKVVSGKVPASARPLFSHESLDCASLVRLTNKFSNNILARHLFLTLGEPSETQPASYARSRQRLKAWLAAKGVTGPVTVVNGSGLSTKTQASAQAMSQVLETGLKSPFSHEWIASLPVAGLDGTMRDRPLATHRAHVKTGQLEKTRSVAGIVRTRDGRDVAVFAAFNGANAAKAVPVFDALLAACAGL